MSDHGVVVRKIEKLTEHPNADRLEQARVSGMSLNLIVAKDEYVVGDKVLVIQDGLILPEAMVDHFELSFLSKGTVKVAKLRGVYSQGLTLPLEQVLNYSDQFASEYEPDNDDKDYARVLGIYRKVTDHQGDLAGDLPAGVMKYDLENVERYPELFEALIGRVVAITEKLEGTNFAVHYVAGDDSPTYCSRSGVRKDGMYVEAPKMAGITRETLDAFIRQVDVDANSVTIRGEIIGTGVQGNIYGLSKKQCFVFDVMVDGRYMSFDKVCEYCNMMGLGVVPVLYQGIMPYSNVDDLTKAADGVSVLPDSDTLREGIVIEGYSEDGQRIIFKARSKEYLSS